VDMRRRLALLVPAFACAALLGGCEATPTGNTARVGPTVMPSSWPHPPAGTPACGPLAHGLTAAITTARVGDRVPITAFLQNDGSPCSLPERCDYPTPAVQMPDGSPLMGWSTADCAAGTNILMRHGDRITWDLSWDTGSSQCGFRVGIQVCRPELLPLRPGRYVVSASHEEGLLRESGDGVGAIAGGTSLIIGSVVVTLTS
jgi:hypothetical protein